MATTSFTLCMLTLVLLFAAATAKPEEIVNPGESCRQETEGQRLSSCQRYLRDSSRCDDGGGAWREEFPQCCDALERINEPCRCEAVRKIVEEEREVRGRMEGREMQEMLMTAQSLPSLCRISPRRSCQNIRGAPI